MSHDDFTSQVGNYHSGWEKVTLSPNVLLLFFYRALESESKIEVTTISKIFQEYWKVKVKWKGKGSVTQGRLRKYVLNSHTLDGKHDGEVDKLQKEFLEGWLHEGQDTLSGRWEERDNGLSDELVNVEPPPWAAGDVGLPPRLPLLHSPCLFFHNSPGHFNIWTSVESSFEKDHNGW